MPEKGLKLFLVTKEELLYLVNNHYREECIANGVDEAGSGKEVPQIAVIGF